MARGTCGCKDALATAIITRPEHVPEQTKKDLAPIVGVMNILKPLHP